MRKTNSIKNFVTDIIPYFIFAIIGFLQVKLFINNLGEEIYSLNQLFIQLFSYISLVEGGVGAIISQKYYKLFVDNDKERIKIVYNSSKKAMKNISLIIIIIGIVLSFFLKFITNNSLSLLYMQVVFFLYVLRSVIEYLNLPPRFVIQADQKLYKINLRVNIFKFIEAIIQLILIINKFDFIIILIISIILRIIMYKFVNKKIFNEYPWLNKKEKLSTFKIKGIGYMYYHKIAGVIYNNVDILLISSKMEPIYVTAYSSFNYLTRYINDVVFMLGNSLMASLGNAVYKENSETSKKIFDELLSFFMFLAVFFSVNMLVLSKSFVSIWIGEIYLLDNLTIFMISFLLFASISKRILSLLCEIKGLYKETKNIVILESIVNLILSIILINIYGIKGVILATIIAYFITTFWYYPIYIFKKIFNNGIGNYIKVYSISITLFLLSFVINSILNYAITSFTVWIIYACISALSSGFVIFVIFYISNKSFRNLIKKILLLVRRKKI